MLVIQQFHLQPRPTTDVAERIVAFSRKLYTLNLALDLELS